MTHKALEEEPEFKGKYDFLAQVGSGGMGVVYKARQTVLNKLVAIKMLHPHMVSTDALRRFQIEGKAVSLLQHPYIIKVHDLSTTESGQPFMVMDFVEGRTLAQIIEREGPLSMDKFLRIFAQICDALAHAHNRGVLHRDLKPSNIMLTRRDGEEEVRIMDFGIAKLIDNDDPTGSNQLTKTGETIGSAPYVSPEQIRGGKTDARADLYSVGCVMYEALTGAPPFSGSTPAETMTMQLSEKPRSMSQSLSGRIEFHPDLEAMVARLLEKNPALRYQSMEELKSALTRLQSGQALDRFVDTAPVAARINWQLVSIAALAACVSVAVLVAAYSLMNRPAPTAHDAVPAPAPLKPAPEPGEESKWDITDMARRQDSVLNFSDYPNEIRNDDIEPLENATNATEIRLTGAHIDDRGLKHIAQLKLKILKLGKTRVKDLDALKNMTTLENLDLEQTPVNDQGMKVLAHLTNLQELNIAKTEVSDAGLNYLSGLKHLRTLEVHDYSKITKDGLELLQKKLPSLTFFPALVSESAAPDDSWKPLTKQAESFNRDNKPSEAAAKFGQALKILRKIDPPSLFMIGSCSNSQAVSLVIHSRKLAIANPKADHIAIMQEALACFEQSERAYEEFLPIAPPDRKKSGQAELRGVYITHASVLEPADCRQAANLREKARKLVDEPGRDDPNMIANLLGLGCDMVALGDDSKAEPLFNEAITRFKRIGKYDALEGAYASDWLGDVYYRQHRWKEALANYEHGMSVIRTHPELWNNAGELRCTAACAYEEVGRNADAEKLFKEVLKYQPTRQEAYQHLIAVLKKEHQEDEAARYESKLHTLSAKSKTHG